MGSGLGWVCVAAPALPFFLLLIPNPPLRARGHIQPRESLLGIPHIPQTPRSSPKAVPESHSGGSQPLPAFPVRARVCLCCRGGSGRAQTPFGGSLEGLQEVGGPWPCPELGPCVEWAQGWSRRWFPVHCGVCGESREWTKLEDPGECLGQRQQLPGPSFYPRDTRSGWILCVVGFSCPAAPPGGPGAPWGWGCRGGFASPPRPPRLPIPTSPIASALNLLQIPEKTENGEVGKLQRWSGRSRERAEPRLGCTRVCGGFTHRPGASRALSWCVLPQSSRSSLCDRFWGLKPSLISAPW